MIIAIIDAFYDSNNNHKLCAEVTKITMDDNLKPNDIIQYHLSSMYSLAHLISKIKIVIPVELDSLFISIDIGFFILMIVTLIGILTAVIDDLRS